MAEAADPGRARFEAARAADDVEAMASAARELAADRVFGAPTAWAGYLYAAYLRATERNLDRLRAGLAVDLARTWAYANEPDRATPFAHVALEIAERLDDTALLAAALDADLLTCWGPDDLAARVAASSRLDGIAGLLTDVEARLSAALWRLTTALETLDVVTVRRQLRLLDDLARESGSARVRLFAASRQGMYALLTDDLAAARRLLDQVREAAAQAGEPDGEALVHVLASGVARQSDDPRALAAEAADYEAFATAQGIRSVLAEAATLWLASGDAAHAKDLLEQVIPDGADGVPRDVDWLLTVTSAVEVAAAVGASEVVRDAAEKLAPFAGRGIVNAGGVAFVGVVDDTLALADTALGAADRAATHAAAAATGYRRIGARWLARRLTDRSTQRAAGDAALPAPPGDPVGAAGPAPAPVGLLAPVDDDVWLVGRQDAPSPVRASKGLRYLRLLLSRPGIALTALELVAAVNGSDPQLVQGDLGEMLDRRALAEYRRRLAELDGDLSAAREAADAGTVARLTDEREFLLDEISSATGLGGRSRRVGGDAERARVAVQKAISAAIRRIGEVDAGLGRLLQDTVRTGATCVYEPDPGRPVRWSLRR